ncbi:MAG TPA: chromosome segregation protein SMC [Candidatus Nanoarchaeia archaeon]|nr:chromosome segregation protein SMC [Candidatus Nanoarchaeia archaeon]
MTYITKLYLHGFKSFAKPTTLEFGNEFNCFIGANGSGKTNLADAIVFVLGSLSPKLMRAEKAANLIFNGGKKGSPMKEAEVSIFFENSKKIFPLETSEVKITRLIKQNGNSVYKINDETATRQQVIELLVHASVDPDGHNIVLQGDIVKFAEMRGDERRGIIEDIAGISMYEDKKHKALLELSKVDAKLNEAEIILTERRTYLKELKKDRDQAVKYRELEKDIKSSKATVLNYQLVQKEGKRKEVDDRIAEYTKEIEKINSKIAELKRFIDEQKLAMHNLNKEIEEKGEVEVVKLQKDIEELKTTAARKSERQNTVVHEISRLHERLKQLQVSVKDTDATIVGLEKSKKELEQKVVHLEKKELSLSDEIKSFREDHQMADASELLALEKKVEVAEGEVQELTQEYNQSLQKKFLLDAQVKQLEEQVAELSKLGSSSEVKKLRSDLKLMTEELQKCLAEDSSLAIQLNKARVALNDANTELYKLQAKQSSLRELAAADLALKRMLGLKHEGIFGLVTDLGETDPRFGLALEVAAGPRMKGLIVDSDKTAADGIKILKEEKLGTCIFVPLNTMKIVPKVNMSGAGIVGNALDLVKFDPKFKNAFSYIFGSTLVVENVETARRLGVGRVRMVTLEGDLFETSGAIVGGHRKVTKSFQFKEKDADEKLQKFEKDIEQSQKLIDHLSTKRSALEDNIMGLRERKSDVEAKLMTLEKTASLVDTEELERTMSKLKDDTIFVQVKKLEGALKDKSEVIEELRKQRDRAKQNAQDLSNPEVVAALEKLEQSKAKTREEMVQLRTELKNIDLQLHNIYLPEKDKALQILKQQEKELELFSQEKVALEKELKENVAGLKERELQEEKFQKNFRSLFAQRNKISEETVKKESLVNNEQGKIREIENKLNNTNIARAKIVAEYEALQVEFEPFKGISLRKNVSEEELKSEIRKFEHLMQQMGNVNLRALEIYENIDKEYQELLEKAEKLKMEKEDVLKMMTEIESKKKYMFMKTFREIAKNFENIFLSLSTKGEAFLELENKEEPLSAGLDIKIHMAGSKYLDLRSMSGGEKTLTALALIFAIQEYHPASFYLLDEVDAALDKGNSDLLSKLIAKYSQRAQYIVISHNDNVITEAARIYGVTMQEDNVSKVVSLKF